MGLGLEMPEGGTAVNIAGSIIGGGILEKPIVFPNCGRPGSSMAMEEAGGGWCRPFIIIISASGPGQRSDWIELSLPLELIMLNSKSASSS
jgi:hypothetical protein